jgi:hypothetical protein
MATTVKTFSDLYTDHPLTTLADGDLFAAREVSESVHGAIQKSDLVTTLGIAANTANIAANTTAIATHTTEIAANTTAIAGLMSHGDSCDGRNLLTVLGVSTVAAAMAALSTRCNGTGTPDFSGLMIGDYLDLPSLTVDGTTYTWSDTYQNLRIVISGFNQYIHVGNTENTKNHILWTFKNCVLQRQMNTTNTNTGGYAASALKTYLDGVFALGLGSALGSSDYLYTIRRAISAKSSTGWASETVFLPTEVEVFGVSTYGDDQVAWNTNVQFPIFRNSAFYRIKKYNGSRAWWWEATPYASDAAAFCYVHGDGSSLAGYASVSGGGVAPAFCTC